MPVICEQCKYSYKRKDFRSFYLPYLSDTDYKPYLKISCDLLSEKSYLSALPSVICRLCKYNFQNSHKRKDFFAYYMSKAVNTDYKSYRGIFPIRRYKSSNYIIKHSYRRKDSYYCHILSYISGILVDNIHRKKYWRKVFPLYIQNSIVLIYYLECPNIFITLMKLVKKLMLNKLLIYLHDIYNHG